jgi:Tfp pilus assembly protein PilX
MGKKSIIANENGVILVLALFLIAALSLIGLAANQNIAIDTNIGSNHLESVQAFYIAEAGLETGEQEVVLKLISTDLKDFSSLINTTLIDKKPSANGGYCTVTILNNTDEANPVVDSDRIIHIRSKGTINSSTSTVSATIKVHVVPKIPGGLTFINDADIVDNGITYRISGYDYRLTDSESSPTGPLPSRPAIALCQTTDGGDTVASVTNELNQTNLFGSTKIANSTDLSKQMLNEYMSSLIPKSRGSIDCNIINLTYYNSQDNGGSGLDMGCSNGKGILIVDGDLTFLNHANWQGIVIVKGGLLKLNGNNEIRGGVIIGGDPDPYNQSGNSGLELNINNNVTILYSSEAINYIANQAIKDNGGKWSVLSWQRIQ